MRKFNRKTVLIGALSAAMVLASAMPVLAAEGWKENTTGWWYEYDDGTYVRAQWKLVNGVWYYFNANGYMAKGWINDGGRWYFANASGAMQTGWICVGSEYYYLNQSGAMVTGEAVIGGTTYHFNEYGACTDMMLPANVTKYYADGNVVNKNDHPSGGGGTGSSGGSGGSSVTEGVKDLNNKVNEKVDNVIEEAKNDNIIDEKSPEAPLRKVTFNEGTNTASKTASVVLNKEKKETTEIADVSNVFVGPAEEIIDDENVQEIIIGDAKFTDKNVAKTQLNNLANSSKKLSELPESYSVKVKLADGSTVTYTVNISTEK